MHSERGGVEVALKLEPGLLHKLVVLGIVCHGGKFAERIGAANRLHVDENESIGARKQAGWFWRSAPAKEDGEGDGRCDQQNGKNNGEGVSSSPHDERGSAPADLFWVVHEEGRFYLVVLC